jgi:SAM-dependent methyltransferase
VSDALAGTRSPHFALDATVQTYLGIHLPRVFAPWARVLLEAVAPRPGDTVLDVATRPGTVARQAALLVGPGGRVCGVDISPAMLSVGRAWPPESGAAPIDYVESPAACMPLPDEAFDVAYCQQGLQHMTDPLAALREMRRVLKPGGRLGVALWKQSPFGLFREVVSQMGLAGDDSQPSMFGRDAAELQSALGTEGFEDVEVRTREMVAVLDGGIPQALQVAEATTAGVVLSGLSESGRRSVRDAFTRALKPYVRGESVHLPSVSNIASARRASFAREQGSC